MTDEELDKARAEEAQRLWTAAGHVGPLPTEIAARLAREGWMPVDPDLIEARECVALLAEQSSHRRGGLPEKFRSGKFDDDELVQVALMIIRRAKERNNT